MAVFKCQQFCIVNLPVFKNRSLVSLANNYLVFLLQPNFFSWDFSGAFSFFFLPSWFFFPVKFWGFLFICLYFFYFLLLVFFRGNLFNLVHDAGFHLTPTPRLVLNVNSFVFPPDLADYSTQLKTKPTLSFSCWINSTKMGEIVPSREIDPKKLKLLNWRFICCITDKGLSFWITWSLSSHHLLTDTSSLSDCVTPEHVNVQKFVHKRKLFDTASWDLQKREANFFYQRSWKKLSECYVSPFKQLTNGKMRN